MHGRTTSIGPAHLAQLRLQRWPIELAITQKDDLGPCRDHWAHPLDYGQVECLRTMPLGTLAHTPGEGQGASLIEHVEPPRHTATADDTAIHADHQGVEGSLGQ